MTHALQIPPLTVFFLSFHFLQVVVITIGSVNYRILKKEGYNQELSNEYLNNGYESWILFLVCCTFVFQGSYPSMEVQGCIITMSVHIIKKYYKKGLYYCPRFLKRKTSDVAPKKIYRIMCTSHSVGKIRKMFKYKK